MSKVPVCIDAYFSGEINSPTYVFLESKQAGITTDQVSFQNDFWSGSKQTHYSIKPCQDHEPKYFWNNSWRQKTILDPINYYLSGPKIQVPLLWWISYVRLHGPTNSINHSKLLRATISLLLLTIHSKRESAYSHYLNLTSKPWCSERCMYIRCLTFPHITYQ